MSPRADRVSTPVNRFGKAQRQHIATDMLSSYVDGQLSARQQALVEEHLQGCPTCTEELRTIRYTASLLKAMPPVRLPRAFTLSEADVGRSPAYSPSRRLLTYLRGASAAVAALLVVVVVGDVIQTTSVRQAPQIASAPRAVMSTAIDAPVEMVLEKELPVPVSGDAETPIIEEPLEFAAEELPASAEETHSAQPQAKTVQEYAAPIEPVAAEKAVEAEAEAEKPPEIRGLSVTPEGEDLGMGGGGPPEGEAQGLGSGSSPDGAPLGMGGGGPPEPELLEAASAIDTVEPATQATEVPQEPTVAKELAAQPAPSPAETTAEAVAEVEKVVALTAPIPEPSPTTEPSIPTSEPLPTPSPEEKEPPASETMAAPAEPRPTPIPLRSPTLPSSETHSTQSLVRGWWTPLRALEISLGGLFVVFLILSIVFRRR